jgi:hypothetical protein
MRTFTAFTLLALGISCYGQGTITIYNQSSCEIYVAFTRTGSCPTSQNINFGGQLVQAGSSTQLGWAAGLNNSYLGLFSGSGDVFIYGGSGNPTYSVEFQPSGCAPNCSADLGVNGLNAVSCYIYNVSGNCGGSLPAPTQYTNSGCVTLNNNTSNPQYYQFQSTGGSGTQNFSGCGAGITVQGNQGSSAYGDGNEWLAVYGLDVARRTNR